MKNRRRGFSLVELLIVLAVIAALIATITPVALNAIRKAQATKVAQNIKTLASSFENYLYVEGKDGINDISSIKSLGRDVDEDSYGLAYTNTNGEYTVYVWTSEDVAKDILKNAMPDIYTDTLASLDSSYESLGVDYSESKAYYSYTFVVY